MEELAQYGPPLYQYEGMGEVVFTDDRSAPVYFEARQTENATVIIGCLSSDDNVLSMNVQAVNGYTVDGHFLETFGQPIVTHRHFGTHSPLKLHMVCPGMRVHIGPRTDRDVHSVRFALVNFVFANQTRPPASPLLLPVGGYEIHLLPVDSYEQCVGRLHRSGGVAPTAWCRIRKPDEALQLDQVQSLVEQMLKPVSLAISSMTNWLYYEGFDAQDELALRVHRGSVTRSFSNTGAAFGWWSDIADVVHTWFAPVTSRLVSLDELGIRIDHYLDACARDVFLETRALTSATLLDVLANRYAASTNTDFVVPKEDWESKVKPALDAAFDRTLAADLGVSDAQRRDILTNLKGAYRRSFRKRLTFMLKDLEIPVNGRLREKIIASRNSLVHDGRFHSGRRQWHFEYGALLWACRCILLRLIGYEGDLPPPPG